MTQTKLEVGQEVLERTRKELEDARKWCFAMRQNPWLGPAIQELQSWKPSALYRIVAYLQGTGSAGASSEPNTQHTPKCTCSDCVGYFLREEPAIPARAKETNAGN